MTIKVAINGFGRIGRNVLRNVFERQLPLDVQAVNDNGDLETLAHLFKYDSVHGRFPGTVETTKKQLVINGKMINYFQESSPLNLPWKQLGVDIVIESTGVFRSREKAAQHLTAGAKKVVVTAPVKDSDLTVVMGINQDQYQPKNHNIVSNASCTTNCLVPLCYVVDKHFGIKQGFMSTIHSYTTDQSIHDKSHKDLRRARAAALSIIPTTTGAAEAISTVLPWLRGKIDGMAFRVPTPDASLLDLVVETEKATSLAEITSVMEQEAKGPLKGILAVEKAPLVSVDYISNPFSSTFDPSASMQLNSHLFKLISWYDNEYGYSNRVVDLVAYMAQCGL